MRALIVYYSFTDQTRLATDTVAGTLRDRGWEVSCCPIEFATAKPDFPLKPFWLKMITLGLPSIAERAVPVRFDQSALDTQWDLIVIGSPTWSCSPALPISSWLKTPAARALLSDTRFATFTVCRGFWRRNTRRVRVLGTKAGGRWVDGAGFTFDGNMIRTMRAFVTYHTSAGVQTTGYGLSASTLTRVSAWTEKLTDHLSTMR